MEFKTADICDEFADRVQVCDPVFRSFGAETSFAGAIATVKCFEDNSRVREAVQMPGESRVLVIDAGGSLRCAVLGDRLAEQALHNRWSGIVIFGCIRDAVDIARMKIGVRALATHPLKSIKRGEGQHGSTLRFAGVTFIPGAYLYCDDDGIVVSGDRLM
ncbi:MAG: ribonuclease E activity regulator RraA [Gammaproteobacteria bacterium]|jgi:regulator of ribonuclease activity A|nr:ribonuclease E activity regulator RraA [Gammaproteobacteria bacterium]